MKAFAIIMDMKFFIKCEDAGKLGKSTEGKWNGGFALYGYKLVNGCLEINEEEVEAYPYHLRVICLEMEKLRFLMHLLSARY